VPGPTRRSLGIAGLLVAVLAAWANGVAVRWFAAEFQLFGETADRGDFLVGAGACAATAALLFVALLAIFVFRPPWWLMVTTAIGVGTQLAFAITSYRHAQELTSDLADDTFMDGVKAAFVVPGSWPLLLVLVVAIVVAVRDRSSPARPAPPDR
jgi:hypothetical protein